MRIPPHFENLWILQASTSNANLAVLDYIADAYTFDLISDVVFRSRYPKESYCQNFKSISYLILTCFAPPRTQVESTYTIHKKDAAKDLILLLSSGYSVDMNLLELLHSYCFPSDDSAPLKKHC